MAWSWLHGSQWGSLPGAWVLVVTGWAYLIILFRDREKVERGTEEGGRAKEHIRHESRKETRGGYRGKWGEGGVSLSRISFGTAVIVSNTSYADLK